MPTGAIRAFAVPHWVRLGAIALWYFASAKSSLLFAIPPGYATAVWPPSGIALAALLLLGLRAWPGVWLGAALTNYTIDLSMPAALGIATGNTLEGVCAAWLARRWIESNAEFRQPESVFLFAAIAALASAIAASVGVGSLYVAGTVPGEHFLANWYTWWQGDATGILLVTPCILAWARGGDEPNARADVGEVVAFGVLLATTLVAVFAHGAEGYDAAPLAFLVFPFFVWAACRFSERIVALTVLVANGWAIWCTVNGLGPFQGFEQNEALLMLQAFTSTGALAALVLWALMRRRGDEMRLLRESREALGQNLWTRARGFREQLADCRDALALAHVGKWRWDARANRVEWSEEACRICGVEPGRLDGSFEAYFQHLHVADHDGVRDAIKHAYANHGSWDRSERIVRPDGAVRVVRSIGRTKPPSEGSATRMHGVLIDITDYKAPAPVRPIELAAGALTELGLPEALRARGAQFEIRTGLSVDVSSSDAAGRIDPGTALALYRIAEDALDNVARHASARRVDLELDCDDGLATLTVRDDGGGFAPDWQAKGGDGIKRMRTRAAAVGGKVWIESKPGSGSILRITARG